MGGWLVDAAVTVGGEVLIVLAFLHMLSSRRSPGSMIAWTLAIFLVPYVAVPVYFLFGHRKLIRKYNKLTFTLRPVDGTQPLCDHPLERLLCATGLPPASSDNRFSLHDTPQSAYALLKEEIESAQKSIDICLYQLKLDDVTLPLLTRLAQRAEEGVRVRLLLDSIGSAKLYLFQKRLGFLRKAGVRVIFFMPFLQLPVRNFVNLRNHRKIYIFDNATLVTGGMNLSDDYMAPDERGVYYRDFICRLEGKAVHFYAQIFEADWAFATGTAAQTPPPAPERGGTACIQVAPSGPDTPTDGVVEGLLDAICTAQQRVWIFTPYFVPNDDFQQALSIASHRGVELKIVVPAHSDHLISDLGRGSFLRELASKGAQVLLYRGPVLHAKAMLFDDRCAVVGTINFDNRSLYYNFEAASFLYSPKEIGIIDRWAGKILGETEPYSPSENIWQVRLENLMRMLAPLV
ncbi:phospholipase D-like domain-containing protein [Hydrogenimonas sp. SS33]|uniref:phospholipase D-like domain-containing protein n=1 Tax=Hydrogenimonas leucolamina TaxID=2954236 RepID=UPI00336BCA9B